MLIRHEGHGLRVLKRIRSPCRYNAMLIHYGDTSLTSAETCADFSNLFIDLSPYLLLHHTSGIVVTMRRFSYTFSL